MSASFSSNMLVTRTANSSPPGSTGIQTGTTKTPNGAASNYLIRESNDQGATWWTLAAIADPETDAGHPCPFFYQPFLFEFPQQLGKYSEGTLLLVGNLCDGRITDFFACRSTDHGKTWDSVGKWQNGSLDEAGRI
ncbi:sialidase family protein [Aspergillus lucknowensis]|uniref:Sialidase domain-containing protein n=1 Tax=Aspergillus lucknowensis TaxID=176173 RepID=A0ABR4M0J3_9EURO